MEEKFWQCDTVKKNKDCNMHINFLKLLLYKSGKVMYLCKSF